MATSTDEASIGDNKSHIRMRFRNLIRRVIDNLGWMSPNAEHIRQGQAIKAGYIPQKFLQEKLRDILLTPHHKRKTEDLQSVVLLIERIATFKYLPSKILKKLASVADFAYVNKGKTIIRNGQYPQNIYALLSGIIELKRVETNTTGKEYETVDRGYKGKTFGDHAIVYNTPIMNTVYTIVGTELIVISKKDFDEIVGDIIYKQWTAIQGAMLVYEHYFGMLNHNEKNNILISGKITDYTKGSLIFDCSNHSTHQNSYFLLKGDCDVIELLEVTRLYNTNGEEYFVKADILATSPGGPNENTHISMKALALADKKMQPKPHKEFMPIVAQSDLKTKNDISSKSNIEPFINESSPFSKISLEDYVAISGMQSEMFKKMSKESNKRIAKGITIDKTCASQMDSKTISHLERISNELQLSPLGGNTEKHFIKVCTYHERGCFNIGETLKKRIIYCTKDVRVLQFPKMILLKEMHDLWKRVARTLDATLPDANQLFQIFIRNRIYSYYKKTLVETLYQNEKTCRSKNSLSNVPYSIRIREDLQFTDINIRKNCSAQKTSKSIIKLHALALNRKRIKNKSK